MPTCFDQNFLKSTNSTSIQVSPDSSRRDLNRGAKRFLFSVNFVVDEVPDYATIFELAGVLAREQGKTDRAVEEFSEALRILEGCTDAKNMDVRYLRDEIKELSELSEQAEHTSVLEA